MHYKIIATIIVMGMLVALVTGAKSTKTQRAVHGVSLLVIVTSTAIAAILTIWGF